MLFDDLCRMAERHSLDIRPKCVSARLFRFDVEEALEGDPWEYDTQLVENLRLPFEVVAFESAPTRDSRGEFCALLYAIDVTDRQYGFVLLHAADRKYGRRDAYRLDHGAVTFFPSGWSPDNPAGLQVRLDGLRVGCVQHDEYTRLPTPDLREVEAVVDPDRMHAIRLESNEIESDISRRFQAGQPFDDDAVALRKLSLHYGRFTYCYLGVVLDRLLRINDPARFVVEETPLATARAPRPGTIARSPWRPHYIVLKPKEIRTRLKLDHPVAEGGQTRAPHERRGHFRRFTAERYVNVQGQIRWVEACWVGPREAVLGPNKYVVRLDL